MSDRERAYVGLGANEGESQPTLEAAIATLGALPGVDVEAVSRLYRTRPVGGIRQADFLNAVVALDVPAGPDPEQGAMALLVALKGIERALGRRERERWGPREVDLDVLLFGPHRVHVERDARVRSDDPARAGAQWLDVPHPHASERLFVLAPLEELAADVRPPGWEASVGTMSRRARALEGPAAVRVVASWDPVSLRWIAGGG